MSKDSLSHFINGPKDVIAIDPGISGAVVRLGKGNLEIYRGFKSLEEIPSAIMDALGDSAPDHIVIEHVWARPGEGVVSVFSFGRSDGFARGAIQMAKDMRFAGVALDQVAPVKWQNWCKKQFGLEGLKAGEFDSSKLIFRALPEYVDLFRKRPRKKGEKGWPDHNASDAALIGLWRLGQNI